MANTVQPWKRRERRDGHLFLPAWRDRMVDFRPAHRPYGREADRARRGEACALAPWLRDIRFAHVLTSPRQRARRTCELAGLGATAKTEGSWRSGTMAITRASVPGIFARPEPAGTSSRTAARRRIACTGSGSRGSAHRRACGVGWQHGAVLAWRVRVRSGRALDCVAHVRWSQHFSLGPASLSILGHRAGHPDIRTISLWNAGPAPLPS